MYVEHKKSTLIEESAEYSLVAQDGSKDLSLGITL